MTRGEPRLSVVIPIYDELDAIDELVRRVTAVLDKIENSEVIFVDDGSTDGSWERLCTNAADDTRFRVARLSRNFGHQVAISAGLDLAQGDAVVVMDGDLQHPPELIPTLLERWREGYDVVNVVPAERAKVGWLKHATAATFYRLFGRLSDVDSTHSVGDFRLLSRRAVDALASMPERARFLRGMAAWIGYRHTSVPYRPAARFAGTSKYPPRRMVRLAMDGLTSFSAAPLRLVSAIGLSFVVFCALYLTYVLSLHFFTDRTIQGWTTVVVLILLIGGVQMLSLGMVGQYVARVFDEAKQRPLYLLDSLYENGRLHDGRDVQSTATPEDAIGVRRPRAPTRTP